MGAIFANLDKIINLSLIYATFRSATPIIFAALCAAITQQANILNVGTEGIMLVGAFTAVAVSYFTGCWVIGVLAGMLAGAVTGIFHTVLEIPAILAGILTQISLWSVNLRIMGGKSNLPLLKLETLISGVSDRLSLTQAQASMIVGVITALALIWLLYWFFGTEVGSALRATGYNEDMIRALGVNTGTMKLFGLMLANGLVSLSGALVCQHQKYADINMGRGAIVIGLAAIVIGEVLMSRVINFGMKLLSVVVGSIVYFIIRALVLDFGLNTNDMNLFTALFVAVALSVPVLMAKWKAKQAYSETGEEDEA